MQPTTTPPCLRILPVALGRFIVVLLPVSVTACTEGEPGPDAVSEYVELYLDEGIEVCGGQLQAYDGFIERAFEVWTGDSPEDFVARVHVTDDVPCTIRRSCATPGNVWLGNLEGDFHELGHVVVESRDGWSNAALTEGAAETLGPILPYYLLPNVELGPDVLSADIHDLDIYGYSTMAVASRFLMERHGVDAFRGFYRAVAEQEAPTQAEIEQQFEFAFGEPIDDAWSILQSEPRCTFDLWYCDAEPAQELPVEIDGFDCADPSVTGFLASSIPAPIDSKMLDPFSPRRIVNFRVDEDQPLELEIGNANATIMRCGPCADRPPAIGLTRDYEAAPFELPFAAGTYALVVRPFGDGPPSFSVRPVR